MKNKKNIILLFALVVLAQLYIPLQMIFNQEDIIKTGTEFKFKTEPIDPNDPFRGKYIILNYKERKIPVKNVKKWDYNQTVFAELGKDKNGYAKIILISKNKPQKKSNYFTAKISFINTYKDNYILLDIPFDRFYVNENKAKKAETTYVESMVDQKNKTYALVAIKNGEAVIKDVRINEVSIRDLADKK